MLAPMVVETLEEAPVRIVVLLTYMSESMRKTKVEGGQVLWCADLARALSRIPTHLEHNSAHPDGVDERELKPSVERRLALVRLFARFAAHKSRPIESVQAHAAVWG